MIFFGGPFILKLTPTTPSPVFFPTKISPTSGIDAIIELSFVAGTKVPLKLTILPLSTYPSNKIDSEQDINKLKVLLANEATKILHGEKAAKESETTAQKTFEDKSIGKNLPTVKVKKNIITAGFNILDLVLQTKLANSKGEIRRMIKNNGLRINNEIVTDETKIIDQSNFDENNNMKVSHGKKQHVIVKII